MRQPDFRGIDLNLLVVLRALLETRSVTHTAKQLNMSQPAVSRALSKLRTLLGDKLLLKSKGGMTPTSRAESLSVPLASLLNQLTSFVTPAVFDPGTTHRLFRIAMTDQAAIIMLPGLMQAFAREAPFASVEIVPFSTDTFSQLENGPLDLVLYSDRPVPDGLMTRTLYNETLTCLLRADHPVLETCERDAQGGLSLDEFTTYPHAHVGIPGQPRSHVDEVLAQLGRQRRIALKLPYFATAAFVCAASDLIAVLPSRVASTLAAGRSLTLVEAPLELRAFGYRMVWHKRSHDDTGAVWLRDLLASSVRDGSRRQGDRRDRRRPA
ncbi:LysR family transcriptional regulator [Ensifer sp. BR816]|uniref:LysR family transcriptional regulator n=1 Tax=Rhizobium sp. (strain BR816) TaxID=1057002 RepID=UPI00039CE4B0|nr:LysR family transcriptional regulator [Ensifer sp. BR816]